MHNISVQIRHKGGRPGERYGTPRVQTVAVETLAHCVGRLFALVTSREN